jgi:hypothetical protein
MEATSRIKAAASFSTREASGGTTRRSGTKKLEASTST